jgi:hypothetical protein
MKGRVFFGVAGVLATIAICAQFFTLENFGYGSICSMDYYD